MTTSKITDEFRTEEVVIRGTTYKLRELSANEYDQIMKIATPEGEDQADLATVLKMMASKSLIEPAGTDIGAKPYPVYSRLLQAVNKLHFAGDVDEVSDNPNE